MTFSEIVNLVARDLNLTAPSAIARIGDHVNLKYRELVALPWLQISRRGEEVATTSIGIRYLTFNATKIYSVFDTTRQGTVLQEYTFDELRNQIVVSDPPNGYAIARQGARSTTIFLDCEPSSVYDLHADVERRTVTLSGDQEPQFSENFHDILYHGAKGLELLKMEKGDLAEASFAMAEKRISDLKFHIAKSAYLQRVQGKNSQDSPFLVNNVIPG